MKKYDSLEIARVVGEPIDPEKRQTTLIDAICQTDTAAPDDYYYYFDVLTETEKVYIITSTGEITQENVTADTPALLSFADLASPEYYVKLTDLAKAKEKTLARKKRTINAALNKYENYNILSLISTAMPAGNKFERVSATALRFTYERLVTMIDSIIDYSDSYVLVAGSTIDKQIKLWNWNDNKNQSLSEALADLNVRIIRVFGSVTIDGAATDILTANTAYLIGLNSEIGKPVIFVRKQLSAIDLLGGAITQDGDMPERLVYVSPSPIHTTGGSTVRYLAVGITGFEEYGAAVINANALAQYIDQ